MTAAANGTSEADLNLLVEVVPDSVVLLYLFPDSMLQAGANALICDKFRNGTILYSVAEQGYDHLIPSIIRLGVDINAVTKANATSLYIVSNPFIGEPSAADNFPAGFLQWSCCLCGCSHDGACRAQHSKCSRTNCLLHCSTAGACAHYQVAEVCIRCSNPFKRRLFAPSCGCAWRSFRMCGRAYLRWRQRVGLEHARTDTIASCRSQSTSSCFTSAARTHAGQQLTKLSGRWPLVVCLCFNK